MSFLEGKLTASPREIAEALGPEWRSGAMNVSLQKMLAQMTRNHLLTRVARGRYSLSPSYRLRGVDGRDKIEREIEKYLEARGGIARTSEILKAVGFPEFIDVECLPVGSLKQGYSRRLITQVLKASPRFQQHHGYGYWNLSAAARESLPLVGKWAAYQIEARWHELGDHGDFDTVYQKKLSFFRDVGSAFEDARHGRGLSFEDVVSDPAVQAVLPQLGIVANAARANAMAEIRLENEAKARSEGITSPYSIAKRGRETNDSRLALYLYASFEAGDMNLHLHAPVELYAACAALFGVSAARLSRGEVWSLPTGIP